MPGAVTRLAALIWVTSVPDRNEHAVTSDELDALPSGRLVAICGAVVLPAPLVVPPESACRHCVDAIQRRAQRRRRGRHARPSLWARLVRQGRHGSWDAARSLHCDRVESPSRRPKRRHGS